MENKIILLCQKHVQVLFASLKHLIVCSRLHREACKRLWCKRTCRLARSEQIVCYATPEPLIVFIVTSRYSFQPSKRSYHYTYPGRRVCDGVYTCTSNQYVNIGKMLRWSSLLLGTVKAQWHLTGGRAFVYAVHNVGVDISHRVTTQTHGSSFAAHLISMLCLWSVCHSRRPLRVFCHEQPLNHALWRRAKCQSTQRENYQYMSAGSWLGPGVKGRGLWSRGSALGRNSSMMRTRLEWQDGGELRVRLLVKVQNKNNFFPEDTTRHASANTQTSKALLKERQRQ